MGYSMKWNEDDFPYNQGSMYTLSDDLVEALEQVRSVEGPEDKEIGRALFQLGTVKYQIADLAPKTEIWFNHYEGKEPNEGWNSVLKKDLMYVHGVKTPQLWAIVHEHYAIHSSRNQTEEAGRSLETIFDGYWTNLWDRDCSQH